MSLTIVRDRPSRRRAYGINAPLYVSVAGGARVRAHEWSHLGLVLDRDDLPPLDGGLAHVTLHLNFQGYEIGVPAMAREDATGEMDPGADRIRLEFVDLPQRSAELIEHFVEDYVRGRIVPAQDTLVRIDAPAEPISTQPDKPKEEAKPKRNWKPLVMTLFYLVLGTGVMGYIGVLLYTNYVRLEVRSAVVSRSIETLRLNTNATIAEVLRNEGDRVRRGEVIVRLADPELDAEVERAEAVLATAKAATRRARRRLAIEERRIRDYRALDDQERERTEEEVRRRLERWLRSVRRLQRAVVAPIEPIPPPSLVFFQPGDASSSCEARLKDREWADLTAIRLMLPEPLAVRDYRRAELVTCGELLALYREHRRDYEAFKQARRERDRRFKIDRLSDVRLFNGREFVVDLDVALLERDKAKAKEAEAAAVIEALKRSRDGAEVRSASGGRVSRMLAVPALAMNRGEAVAVVEADVPPVVDVYLTQEEAEVIALGDRVDVYVAALDRHMGASVVRLDRTEGFRDEQRDRVLWRGPKDRSALAVLRFDESEVTGDLETGLPVTALFHRHDPSAGPGVLARKLRGTLSGDAEAAIPTMIP